MLDVDGHVRVDLGEGAQELGPVADIVPDADGDEPPCGILGPCVAPESVAAGLLESLTSAGIRVPRDMSIVGWDDSPLARLPHLNLTTVRQDPVEMSRLAVERSVRRLRGESVSEREVVLSPGLVVRASTAAPGH